MMATPKQMNLKDLIHVMDAPMGEALDAKMSHFEGMFLFNHFDTSMVTSSSMVELNLMPDGDTGQGMTLKALREELMVLVETLGDTCPTTIHLYLWDDGDRLRITQLSPSPVGLTVSADMDCVV